MLSTNPTGNLGTNHLCNGWERHDNNREFRVKSNNARHCLQLSSSEILRQAWPEQFFLSLRVFDQTERWGADHSFIEDAGEQSKTAPRDSRMPVAGT
jgi:hypothetical protein